MPAKDKNEDKGKGKAKDNVNNKPNDEAKAHPGTNFKSIFEAEVNRIKSTPTTGPTAPGNDSNKEEPSIAEELDTLKTRSNILEEAGAPKFSLREILGAVEKPSDEELKGLDIEFGDMVAVYNCLSELFPEEKLGELKSDGTIEGRGDAGGKKKDEKWWIVS